MDVKERLVEWQAAGVIDSATASRIETFEASRPPAERRSGGITVSEVVAYIGAIVLLVGLGFLYGTQYETLGTPGRLLLIGLVVVAGFAAGELVRRLGAAAAVRRARAAGWSVAALATAAWLAQFFKDAGIMTQPPDSQFGGGGPDASGSVMLAAVIGAVLAGVLLWRAGAGLLGFVFAALSYTAVIALITYLGMQNPGWDGEAYVLVAAIVLAVSAELLTRGRDRQWAREIVRFAALLVPVFFGLGFSNNPPGDVALEIFAGALAIAGFGLALVRGSAGFAIAAGIGLFVFVNEVGFRHFSNTLGFPVVLIISGIALFAISGGLVAVLRRTRRPA